MNELYTLFLRFKETLNNQKTNTLWKTFTHAHTKHSSNRRSLIEVLISVSGISGAVAGCHLPAGLNGSDHIFTPTG